MYFKTSCPRCEAEMIVENRGSNYKNSKPKCTSCKKTYSLYYKGKGWIKLKGPFGSRREAEKSSLKNTEIWW